MENRSHNDSVSWGVFNERRKGVDGRFEDMNRRIGATEDRLETIERRINWLIGLALLGIGMLALNLFLSLAKQGVT